MTPRPLRLVALLLLVPALSGCFGYPEGAVRASDQLGVLYTAKDPSSGAALPGECFAGGPFGDAPAEIKQQVLGEVVAPGTKVTVIVAAGVPCHRVHRVPALLVEADRKDTYQVVSREVFEDAVGEAPVVAKQYSVPTPGGVLTFTVVRTNATTVEYEPIDPVRYFPQYGLDLVSVFRGDKVALLLVANVTGAVFAGPLEDAIPIPGNLTVIGSDGDLILVAERDARPVLGSEMVQLSATILYVHAGSIDPDKSGFGHRDSSVVSRSTETASLLSSSHDADGHTH